MTVAGETKISTSSVSPDLLQGFSCGLARVAFLLTQLAIDMKATWQASFLKSHEEANQCKISGETEEVCLKC